LAVKTASEMTYTVSSGALNSTHLHSLLAEEANRCRTLEPQSRIVPTHTGSQKSLGVNSIVLRGLHPISGSDKKANG